MPNIRYTSCVILLASYMLLSSCSVSRQIGRSAKQVIGDSSLLAAHVGISIYEPATAKYRFNYQGDKYFVPASNTKIPTCYAAMKYLGDSLVGVLYDDSADVLKLIGTGDPTFLHPDFIIHPVYDFIKRNVSRNVLLLENAPAHTTTSVIPYGNGWSWNDYSYSYMTERSFFPIYGNVVRLKLQNGNVEASPRFFQRHIFYRTDKPLTGFSAERQQWTNSFFISEGNEKYREIPVKTGMLHNIISVEDSLLSDTVKLNIRFGKTSYRTLKGLKKVYSQPTDSLLRPMMYRSDNFFAEQSLLMVSNEMLGYMNDAAVIDTLLKTDFGDLPQKPRWADGSGLSRYNLFTPQDFVFILNKMKNEFGMDRLKVILPTGGKGTLTNYYVSDKDFIYAKTGTLSGVVAISGYLYTKKNRLLIFSVLVNNHNQSATAVRKAIEKFISSVREKN